MSRKAQVLTRTMDVYLQDPIVDWVQSCKKKRGGTTKKKAIADDEATQVSADNDDDGGSDDDDGAADEDEDGEDDDDASWEPARRIRNASRKLQGYNPIDIMLDDLQQNRFVSTNDSSRALAEILRGQVVLGSGDAGGGGRNAKAPEAPPHRPERCTRKALQEPRLEVADQVSCLIDIATDPNVIGRQWQGLSMWL